MSIKKFIASALTAGFMLSFIPATAMADSTGWQQVESGWRYYISASDYVKNAWQEDAGKWYYLDEDGYALTDTWAYIDGGLYHFNKSGAMEKNKWIECGVYTLSGQAKEYMAANSDYAKVMGEYVGKKLWRYVGSNGKAYTGWKQIGGTWYHFNEDIGYDYSRLIDVSEHYQYSYAVMTYGWFTDKDGSMYNFDGNGKYRTGGWKTGIDEWGINNWFYFGSDGRAYQGWKTINNKQYYFGSRYDGGGAPAMIKGYFETYDDGFKPYYFADDGHLLTTGWYEFKYEEGGSKWIYVEPEGTICFSEWLNYGGKWYYFRYDTMISDVEDFVINGKKYDFDKNGVCLNYDGSSDQDLKGWHSVKEDYGEENTLWYYIGSDGKRLTKQWLSYGGTWYYFDELGWMISDYDFYRIDGKHYSFNKDGKCTTPNGIVTKAGWYCDDQDEAFVNWYYYGSDLKFYTGWHQINGKWYFFEIDGKMATGFETLSDGKRYYFKDSGEMVTGWFVRYGNEWYYADKSGVVYNNRWLNYKGAWYYFEYRMICDKTGYMIDGKLYDFDSDGKCLNPDSGRIIVAN
ncbi:hypothetical protein [Butyrivibrio sp. AE2032]|uniref:hypothetical protein n=1 Tax=Butyrivibrio sp. AE2032 TaxID=1458463 RepID=UPI000553CFF7|nr:hypothetical protein [Butyrivibrio sp. AE2032]